MLTKKTFFKKNFLLKYTLEPVLSYVYFYTYLCFCLPEYKYPCFTSVQNVSDICRHWTGLSK